MTDDMIQKEQIQRAGGLLLQMLDANNPNHQKMVDSGYILSSQGRVFRAKLFGNKISRYRSRRDPLSGEFPFKRPRAESMFMPG